MTDRNLLRMLYASRCFDLTLFSLLSVTIIMWQRCNSLPKVKLRTTSIICNCKHIFLMCCNPFNSFKLYYDFRQLAPSLSFQKCCVKKLSCPLNTLQVCFCIITNFLILFQTYRTNKFHIKSCRHSPVVPIQSNNSDFLLPKLLLNIDIDNTGKHKLISTI